MLTTTGAGGSDSWDPSRSETPTKGSDQDGATARVADQRTAWQYVTALYEAAVGGPRAPIRGIVEDVQDMRTQLIRERDEARARVAELERRLERREALVASLARQLSVRRRATAAAPRPGRRPSAPPG
jgi:uncharacterized protein with von Willebrand factor type A (vWA) domain